MNGEAFHSCWLFPKIIHPTQWSEIPWSTSSARRCFSTECPGGKHAVACILDHILASSSFLQPLQCCISWALIYESVSSRMTELTERYMWCINPCRALGMYLFPRSMLVEEICCVAIFVCTRKIFRIGLSSSLNLFLFVSSYGAGC